MLNSFRSLIANKITKVLLMLILASFLAQDFFKRQQTHMTIATFADQELSVAEWHDNFSRFIKQFSYYHDLPLDDKHLIAMKFTKDFIFLKILGLEAERLGFEVSDDMVKYKLATAPEFRTSGNFDAIKFQKFLTENNLDEASYVAWSKQYQALSLVNDAFNNNMVEMQLQKQILKDDASTVRRFGVVSVNDLLGNVDITEKELRDFYELHKSEYIIVPERRLISYIRLNSDNIVINQEVGEELLREKFQDYPSGSNFQKAKSVIKANILAERYSEEIERICSKFLESKNSNISLEDFAKTSNFQLYNKVIASDDKNFNTVLSWSVGDAEIIHYKNDVYIVRLNEIKPPVYEEFNNVQRKIKKQFLNMNSKPEVLQAITASKVALLEHAKKHNVEIKYVDRLGYYASNEKEDKHFTINNSMYIYTLPLGKVSVPLIDKDDNTFVIFFDSIVKKHKASDKENPAVVHRNNELLDAYRAFLFKQYRLQIDEKVLFKLL